MAETTERLSADLAALQERCERAEGILAETTGRLSADLAAWQERCERAETTLAETTEKLSADLTAWQERCERAERSVASLAAHQQNLATESAQLVQRNQQLERVSIGTAHEVGQLRRMMEQTLRNFACAPVPDAENAEEFLRMARLFAPAAAIGFGKRRVGDPGDGGYVMLDALGATAQALSFGIGDNVSWDRDMARSGAVVHQFDHAVEGPPEAHPNFRFRRRRIAATPTPGTETICSLLGSLTLDTIASELVMKVDIEHDEWPVLDAAAEEDLARFSQIVCEFHWFGRASDPAWLRRAERVLRKLNALFQVVHVHGNNHVPYLLVAGVPFPSVLEVTYANRRRFRFGPTEERFPTPLDFPNHPHITDHWLGRFTF